MESTASAKPAKDFTWTDDEIEILLRSAIQYKSNCEYEGLSWEGTRAKYEKIREIMIDRYPNEANEEFPRANHTELITKDRLTAKIKKMRSDFKKAVDCGRKSGGGRVVFTFYNLCESLWGGSPAVEGIGSGIESANMQSRGASTGSGGEDASSLDQTNSEDADTAPDSAARYEGNCDESSDTSTKERRAKIAGLLKAKKDKKINRKLTSESQFLNIAREDLELKRKLINSFDKEDSDLKESIAKVNKNMETIAESINKSMGLLVEFMKAQSQPSPSMQGNMWPDLPSQQFMSCYAPPQINSAHPSVISNRSMFYPAPQYDDMIPHDQEGAARSNHGQSGKNYFEL